MNEFTLWRELTTRLKNELGGAGEYVTGALPSWPDKRDFKYANLIGAAAYPGDVPDEVDYSPNMTPVFDQGNLGSCVACAITRGSQEHHEIVQGDLPAGGLSPLFLYKLCKEVDGETGEGTYPRVALKIMQDVGVCPEKLFPYRLWKEAGGVQNVAVPDGLRPLADKYRIKTYAQLCGLGDKSREGAVEIIERAIAREGPVVAALLVCSNFLKVGPPDYIIPLPEGRWLGGHMVCLVGYSRRRKAFKLRNSWGEGWGDNGYAWLPYEWVTHRNIDVGGWFFFEAWTTTDIQVFKPAKQIELQINNRIAVVDGQEIEMDHAPIIVQATGRTLVPLRFVGSNMGYVVKWESDGKRIILTSAS